uniref:Uncharacterized protein n=1 Tax=viral metagenome TaxID=1070528 RepID=A0A6M3X5V4_9ZZZZ
MATFFALMIVISALLGAFLILYFFCAIARIWHYAKKQVELLEDIEEHVHNTERFYGYIHKAINIIGQKKE